MTFKRTQKSLEQTGCRRCNLATPAWCAECIHCGAPISLGADPEGELGTAESQIKQRLEQQAR